MSALVAVNIGNSSIRLGLYPADAASASAPSASWILRRERADYAEVMTRLSEEPCYWFVSSVHRAAESQLAAWVRDQRPQDRYRQITAADVPLPIDVRFPERVGMDRLMAAVAANRLRRPGRAAVVVDSGTAITVDLVTNRGTFAGGAILPGFEMSARALAAGTDLLPLIDLRALREPPASVGKDTESAIVSGLFWGAIGSVRELVTRTAEQLEDAPHVYVTGGNGDLLARYLPDADYLPDLVLDGIVIVAAQGEEAR